MTDYSGGAEPMTVPVWVVLLVVLVLTAVALWRARR